MSPATRGKCHGNNTHYERTRYEQRQAQHVAYRKEMDFADAVKESKDARYYLREMPRSADEFRRKEATALRHWFGNRLEPFSTVNHGFKFTQVGTESILIAFDAVVEAAMAADVHFDQDKQQASLCKLQAKVAAAEPAISSKVAGLIRPNVSLLTGESS